MGPEASLALLLKRDKNRVGGGQSFGTAAGIQDEKGGLTS